MKPPEYLGPYRIGETLGKGGMGSVFKAQHVKSGQDVAVKLISASMSDEMRFRRRFDAEIKTLKLLSHPNIVKLIGFGEEQGMLFYSMEYVQGETLQEMIRREKKLPWMTALDIAIQICGALKHAHDFGVIHRDLKPANLVVQDDGTVKLLDFGISKIFGQDQTAAGSIMGTADYMAPEQANESGITARTDLFSLGCVLYAMLCGKPPFRGKNITEVIAALQYKDPVPLDLVDPDLPDDVVQIVGELLEKLPENRPPTALAVMNRLKAMRAGLHRLQTLADRPKSEPEQSPQADAGSRARQRPMGPQFDTTGPESERGKKTSIQSAKTRAEDTLPTSDSEPDQATSVAGVDPSAHTVRTEGRSGHRGTVLGTALTAPLASGDVSDRDEAEFEVPRDADTAIGSGGKTHFQTVSDGSVREGFFVAPKAASEHPVLRAVSIAALVLMLLIGVGFIVFFARAPTAEELLARIDSPDPGVQTYEIQNEMERFLKLFPDHPRAGEVRQRETVFRVDAAIRRLKRNAKLQLDERPLFERSFLEAMELRQSDPQAAQEKLRQWIAVFNDPTLDAESQQRRLAELAEFEADRLAQLQSELERVPGDPKLVELMQRIDNARQLPADDQRRLLQGIIALYEGQPWAEPARQLAAEILKTEFQ